MLHILFTILISLGAANMQVVEQPREFTKKSADQELYDDKILLDVTEEGGGW